MYKSNTNYVGFRTGRVLDLMGGSQMVWIDNVDHWTVVHIIRGGPSNLVAEYSK